MDPLLSGCPLCDRLLFFLVRICVRCERTFLPAPPFEEQAGAQAPSHYSTLRQARQAHFASLAGQPGLFTLRC